MVARGRYSRVNILRLLLRVRLTLSLLSWAKKSRPHGVVESGRTHTIKGLFEWRNGAALGIPAAVRTERVLDPDNGLSEYLRARHKQYPGPAVFTSPDGTTRIHLAGGGRFLPAHALALLLPYLYSLVSNRLELGC